MTDQPIPPTHGLWPDAKRGPWLYQFHWADVDGRTECVGMELRSVRLEGIDTLDPNVRLKPTKLTTTVVREFPLGRLVDEWRPRLAGFLTYWGRQDISGRRAELLKKAERFERKRAKGGGRTHGPDHWVEVADVYLAAGSKPTKAVADKMHVSVSTAGKWVERCRAMGLIPPTSQGKPTAVKPKGARRGTR